MSQRRCSERGREVDVGSSGDQELWFMYYLGPKGSGKCVYGDLDRGVEERISQRAEGPVGI